MASKLHGYGVSTDRDAKNLAEVLAIIAQNVTIAAKATTDDPQAYAAFVGMVAAHGSNPFELTPEVVLANQAAALYRVAFYILTNQWPSAATSEEVRVAYEEAR